MAPQATQALRSRVYLPYLPRILGALLGAYFTRRRRLQTARIEVDGEAADLSRLAGSFVQSPEQPVVARRRSCNRTCNRRTCNRTCNCACNRACSHSSPIAARACSRRGEAGPFGAVSGVRLATYLCYLLPSTFYLLPIAYR